MSHTIGKNVQALRIKRRLSCAQVAKLSDLSRAAIYAIESGEYKGVQTRTLERIAKALSVDSGDLLKPRRAPKTRRH